MNREELNELLFNNFSESHFFFFPFMAKIVTVADVYCSYYYLSFVAMEFNWYGVNLKIGFCERNILLGV